jgi:hypothetical protein
VPCKLRIALTLTCTIVYVKLKTHCMASCQNLKFKMDWTSKLDNFNQTCKWILRCFAVVSNQFSKTLFRCWKKPLHHDLFNQTLSSIHTGILQSKITDVFAWSPLALSTLVEMIWKEMIPTASHNPRCPRKVITLTVAGIFTRIFAVNFANVYRA